MSVLIRPGVEFGCDERILYWTWFFKQSDFTFKFNIGIGSFTLGDTSTLGSGANYNILLDIIK